MKMPRLAFALIVRVGIALILTHGANVLQPLVAATQFELSQRVIGPRLFPKEGDYAVVSVPLTTRSSIVVAVTDLGGRDAYRSQLYVIDLSENSVRSVPLPSPVRRIESISISDLDSIYIIGSWRVQDPGGFETSESSIYYLDYNMSVWHKVSTPSPASALKGALLISRDGVGVYSWYARYTGVDPNQLCFVYLKSQAQGACVNLPKGVEAPSWHRSLTDGFFIGSDSSGNLLMGHSDGLTTQVVAKTIEHLPWFFVGERSSTIVGWSSFGEYLTWNRSLQRVSVGIEPTLREMGPFHVIGMYGSSIVIIRPTASRACIAAELQNGKVTQTQSFVCELDLELEQNWSRTFVSVGERLVYISVSQQGDFVLNEIIER